MRTSFTKGISTLSPKQKTGALLAVLFVLLIPSILVVQNEQTDTRSRATGSNEVEIRIDPESLTQSRTNQFTSTISLVKTAGRAITVSGAQAVIDVPSSVFAINSATCLSPFNGTPFTSIVGSRVTLFCAISPGYQAVNMTSSPTVFGSINLTVNANAPLGATQLVFVSTRATEAGIANQSPDVSTSGTNATLTILDTLPITPDPTLGPSITSVINPSPTPPSNNDSYTIPIGTKDSLTINIGPGNMLLVHFKAKLQHVENTPDLIMRLRVKDELAFTQNPPSSTDTCQVPGTGSRDFYIPVSADANGVYSPTSTASVTPPSGIVLATVGSDGWVGLPGLAQDRFYTLSLKGPKTRGTKMVEHLKLVPDKPSSQDFDWTGNALFPGDLPDPNSDNKQDCTVNSIDLSLMVNRQGMTDQVSLDVADVTYDGVVNGNDIAKVVNTLSTKPDDD